MRTRAAWILLTVVMLAGVRTARAAQHWRVLPESSELAFFASYDRIEFKGVFHRFDSDLWFSADDLAHSHFRVTVDVASVDTRSEDRDEALSEAEWFDFKRFPSAYFTATHIKDAGDKGFVARADLQIRDKQRPLAFPFTFVVSGDSAHLRAQMRAKVLLNRLDYDIGSGDWADDDLVGFGVRVVVDLHLQAVP